MFVFSAKCFVMFWVKPAGISTNCVALLSMSNPWSMSCCGLIFLTIVTFAPTFVRLSMRVWLQMSLSLLRISRLVFWACSMAVCCAYPSTAPSAGNIIMGIIMMPMRIFGSRISSLSSFMNMLLKPLSIANHLCENFFQVCAVVFGFEFLWFAFHYDFAFVDDCYAIAQVLNFEHVVAAEEHGDVLGFYVLFDGLS